MEPGVSTKVELQLAITTTTMRRATSLQTDMVGFPTSNSHQRGLSGWQKGN